MTQYYGRLGRQLSDHEGLTRYVFQHESGSLAEMWIEHRQVGLENLRVVAKGNLLAPAMILVEKVELDFTLSRSHG